MLKQIGQYISYIMGILGFAGIVWTYATRHADTDYNVNDIRKDLSALKETVATKRDVADLRDTIMNFITRSEKKDMAIINNLNAQRRSWTAWLRDNVKKIDDWVRYMDGLEFELVNSENLKSKFPDTKIRIVKKDTIK